jgi:hypothetical protein
MTQPPDDAQRAMEQRALRNVRALVDKIETRDQLDRRAVRKTLAIIVGVIVLIAAAAYLLIATSAKREPPRTIVLPPPSGAAPAQK